MRTYRTELWRTCTAEEEEPLEILTSASKMPVVLYATYILNEEVLLLAEKIEHNVLRKEYLFQALKSVGDTEHSKHKRRSACAALSRMHSSVAKRRRLGYNTLEEAHDFVAALEDAANERTGNMPHVFLIVLMIQTEGAVRTEVYLRDNIGSAVAESLRGCCVLGFSGVSIIQCDEDTGTEVPASVVLAVVATGIPAEEGVASVMRQIHQGCCDRLLPGEATSMADAMASSMGDVTNSDVVSSW
jgi:hypothetical protein